LSIYPPLKRGIFFIKSKLIFSLLKKEEKMSVSENEMSMDLLCRLHDIKNKVVNQGKQLKRIREDLSNEVKNSAKLSIQISEIKQHITTLESFFIRSLP